MNKNSNNTVNVTAKDRFAKMLATENIHVLHDGKAHTASFNTQSRVLTLPRWQDMSDSLYDMLVAHEVGHALYTPADIDAVRDLAAKHSVDIMVAKDYINVVEDARIERLMKQKFPGLRRDFITAYNDLIERGFFGENALQDDKVAAMQFIDRINLHYKAGTVGACIDFATTEQPFIDQIDAAESWDDILDCADAILDYIGSLPEQDEQDEQSADESDDSTTMDMDDVETGDTDGSGDSMADERDDDTASGGGDVADDDAPQSATIGDNQSTPTAPDQSNKIERSETQQKFEQNVDLLRDRYNGMADSFCGPLKINPEEVMQDWTDLYNGKQDGAASVDGYYRDDNTPLDILDEVDRFLDESRKTCRAMAQEFLRKQKAVAFRRATIAKTGVLDMQKMVNYKWSEDIFRKTTIMPDGKNHGLLILVDWSQSMEQVMKDTIRQAIQMAMFCRMINIPFEMYSFSNVDQGRRQSYFDGRNSDIHFTDADTGEKICGTCLIMRNYLSSRMPKQRFFDACKRVAIMSETYGWRSNISPRYNDRLGATPLDDAIWTATNWLPKYRAENGIEVMNTLIISDGATTSQPADFHTIRDGFRYFRQSKRSSTRTTEQALDVLRHKSGTRLIQFFLTEKKNINRAWYVDLSENTLERERQVAQFKKEKWTVATDDGKQGFDERFIMFGKNTVQNADAFDSIGRADEDGVTITKIRNSFVKAMKQTGTSRAMLNRFIDIIA